MRLQFSTRYKKKYRKLHIAIKYRADERLRLFVVDKFHPLLNNHSVSKIFPGCRSINVTGDYRAIFKEMETEVVFINIGTHSELYD
ncbi:hypothetical protein A2673_01975 [Candidatus Kaiserbacteria bacterium RIFCSPHIGHO2_01_FULL_50_13]|uniref:Plasmid stabilization protein n=1 Tax=Candidatus Kaiserbacteria bacterium RIFCSPLOWO2_01_FULL_50_24 TaxID=1798507 RepID=A0A1F6ER24_9BACT|nr:MAG: hypothetical protein A2673_01975 [Candidatus Kaiserbacteria bacterium RIFCSPHIGHO2_01_FULL_50_13]OGG76080.1 MAG: hypothetical protein A3A34_00570 [Candidatus Kaiserbacteria bacterium RIFCSPLOWO2_01_FULL_50_24]OGG81707.1 MAG: hypothetical protein A3H74_02870 [Candidatus Kaiserbacteria bacterium RIFCSPLOWO2_02_FULL_51_13]